MKTHPKIWAHSSATSHTYKSRQSLILRNSITIPTYGNKSLRGHGSLLGACDTTIKVESLSQCRSGTVDKVNDGPDGERVTFDLKSVELHFDPETNTSTTAPIVIPADAPISISSGPNLSPNQRS